MPKSETATPAARDIPADNGSFRAVTDRRAFAVLTAPLADLQPGQIVFAEAETCEAARALLPADARPATAPEIEAAGTFLHPLPAA